MASQLNSSKSTNRPTWVIMDDLSPLKTVYFARQGKGVFAPISEEEMAVTKKFWMLTYRNSKVNSVEYVTRDKHGDCKIFTQCKQNLPKGIEAMFFLMGVNF